MKQTAVEWLVNELNQKIDFIPMDKWDKIRDIVQQAKEMEKEQIKQIREMLMQGVLTNMSCASAIVELDKITKSE